jgi:hypothetical protein
MMVQVLSIVSIVIYPTKRTTLNTGLSIPPRFWNKKQEVVSDNLPGEHGSASLIKDKLIGLLLLEEDLIKLRIEKII